MKYLIAYDMGTGGLKSSIFDENGVSITSDFKQCDTYYPAGISCRPGRPLNHSAYSKSQPSI
jgi:sugar (pentulose or hexulose) kinase